MCLVKKSCHNEQILLDNLNYKFKLSVSDTVDLLGVSEATVRRLFARLEKKGSAIRIYGGIQIAGDNPFSYSFEKVKAENLNEKRAIGVHASNMVKENSIIYIDSGTTTAQFCRALSKRIKGKEISNIIIFTNSIENLNILSGECEINLIGGKYRPHRKDFYGYIAETTVKKIHFTDCFLGTDGFSKDLHFMTTDFDTAALNEIVLDKSDNKYIIADSSKFSKESFVRFCNLLNPNISIITDAKINEQEVMPLLKQHSNLIVL